MHLSNVIIESDILAPGYGKYVVDGTNAVIKYFKLIRQTKSNSPRYRRINTEFLIIPQQWMDLLVYKRNVLDRYQVFPVKMVYNIRRKL